MDKRDIIWNRLHWYGIPDRPSKAESLSPIMLIHLHSIGYDFTYPLFIYMYNGNIEELEVIAHDLLARTELDNTTIHFYLDEPMNLYMVDCPAVHVMGGTKHTQMFYSEFVGNEEARLIRSDELDSILKYVLKNHTKNIVVHTGDYRVEEFLPHYSRHMKLICDDLFLKTTESITLSDKTPSSNFSKKFISLNRRHTFHRHLIACYLAERDTHLSWYYTTEFDKIKGDVWYEVNAWDKEYRVKLKSGFHYINNNAPFIIDSPEVKVHNLTSSYFKEVFIPQGPLNQSSPDLEPFYRDVFCDVVTESRFAQPTGNFSEKTYKPLFFKKPFILAAPPKTLEYVKSFGYKTFSKYWDESYDACENHQERLLKIFDVIDFIDSKPIEELREMYIDMIPILEHNYKLVNKQVIPYTHDITTPDELAAPSSEELLKKLVTKNMRVLRP